MGLEQKSRSSGAKFTEFIASSLQMQCKVKFNFAWKTRSAEHDRPQVKVQTPTSTSSKLPNEVLSRVEPCLVRNVLGNLLDTRDKAENKEETKLFTWIFLYWLIRDIIQYDYVRPSLNTYSVTASGGWSEL
jgi:hypothetical protein